MTIKVSFLSIINLSALSFLIHSGFGSGRRLNRLTNGAVFDNFPDEKRGGVSSRIRRNLHIRENPGKSKFLMNCRSFRRATENDWISLGDVIQADVGRACPKLNWWMVSSSKN